MGTLYTLNTHRVAPVEVADSQSLDSRIEEAAREAEHAVSVGPWGLLAWAVTFVACIGYWVVTA